MKRRFRSYDYTEEPDCRGKLYVMHIRIRDYVTRTTYYAEYVVSQGFENGHYFYDAEQKPIDDGNYPKELVEYAKRAFEWRLANREETNVLA